MNIGIFSGSFNPIHIGHLILANYITEFTDIDEVWFSVSPQNPFKKGNNLIDEKERFNMLELALTDYPKLKVCDIELNLPKPSYTINMLEKLDKDYPDHHFSLIIGADNWATFDKWKNYEEILKTYKLIVYPRLDYRVVIAPKLRSKVEALDSPIIEISSTFVRENLAKGRDMRVFLPKDVYHYIVNKALYRQI